MMNPAPDKYSDKYSDNYSNNNNDNNNDGRSPAAGTKPVIAIDGTAASGKGTLARTLADKLDMAYLDTGKLYRYVGYQTIQQGGDPANEADATKTARDAQDSLTPQDLEDPALASDEAGNAASQVGQFPGVRAALVALQKDFATRPPADKIGAILDGRDIGTVICPDADIKFYINAATEIRAKRRFKELQSKGISVTYDAVLADMHERDKRDAERQAAPMKAADDAIVIDTSDLGIDEVVDQALHAIRDRLSL